MRTISQNMRGLGLILRLNGDHLLHFGALGLALLGGAAVAGLIAPLP